MERRVAALIPIAVLALALSLVQLPYFWEGPGPARDVEALMTFHGHQRFPSQGHLVLTSVNLSSNELTVFQLLAVALDPSRIAIPESFILFPGESQQHASARAVSDMDQSKLDAAAVVLSKVGGYPKRHRPGVLVESVGTGCPADGKLFPGDLITAVDGKPVADVKGFRALLGAVPAGSPARLTLEVTGKRYSVDLVRRPCQGLKRPVVGIETLDNFPFPLHISSGDIGGPSAGLMWALGLYDLLTPGDLTGGQVIAGTGTIDLSGTVGPIGGVREKIVAARRAGAKVFLVPKCNLQDAEPVASRLKLVPVRNFHDALLFLQRGVVPTVACHHPVIG